jgi:hypothetical protein
MICTRVLTIFLRCPERTWYHRLVGEYKAPSLRLHQRIVL